MAIISSAEGHDKKNAAYALYDGFINNDIFPKCVASPGDPFGTWHFVVIN